MANIKSAPSTHTLRGKTAIIGAGISAVGRVPGKSALALAADAAGKALADALYKELKKSPEFVSEMKALKPLLR